jgi:hypothetical protein
MPRQLLLNRSVICYIPSDKVYSGQSNIVNNVKSVSFHIFNEIQRSQPLSLCIGINECWSYDGSKLYQLKISCSAVQCLVHDAI